MSAQLDDEKRFYERFWALLKNRDLMKVFEHYGPTAFRRSSVLEGFEAFLDAHDFRGHTCVEIGTLNGLTACLLARRFTRVVTVDVANAPLKYEIAALLDIHNIAFVNVKDNVEKAEVIRAVQFDAAYSDGDHARDSQADFELVRRSGRVLFHEHWDAQPSVKKTVMAAADEPDSALVTDGKFALWTGR